MIPRRVLQILVVAALLLPITICVVAGTGKLLQALNDEAGAGFCTRTAVGLGVLWVINLIVLAIVQGINGMSDPPDTDDE